MFFKNKYFFTVNNLIMANFMDLLQSQLTDGLLDQLSNKLGGADKQQTATAASGVFSTIMGALAKNASSQEGASSLSSALENDHDGGVLDGFMDMLGGKAEPTNTRAMNGDGILSHILGEKQGGAIDMISKMSGLGGDKAGSLMSILAPMIMGTLGKAKKEQGMGVEDLTSFITGSVQNHQEKGGKEMGMIGKFLDQDGDGSYMDDLAGMGMKMFGKFFRK
ncbi:MAG: hypothetical protein ACI8P3_001011 [Saprospiraceae bacterium]